MIQLYNLQLYIHTSIFPSTHLSTFHPTIHLFNYLFSASPGNDFRLGACEAPPSIISAYLGK